MTTLRHAVEMLALDSDQILSELHRLLPDGDFTRARVLDIGFQSTVIETHGYVYLVGRHPGAAATYRKEYRVLPSLQTQLPCQIPCPDWYIEKTDVFPYGVMRYPKIAGAPLTRDAMPLADRSRIARDIGHFFKALHRIPAAEFASYADRDYPERLHMARQYCLPTLKERLSGHEYASLKHWFDKAVSVSNLMKCVPTLIHGDLWYENIIAGRTYDRVVGIVDFECFALGDPAKDFAPLKYLGDPLLDKALDAYGSASSDVATFRARIQRHWELRELEGLEYCVKTGDLVEIEDCVRKIREGPILSLTPE